jgi:hypothetical protein
VAFSIQKSNTEENALGNWDNIGTSALLPQNPGASWTLEVPTGGFFKFNVSATGSVRVRIGTPSYDNVTEQSVLLNPIFDQVGTRFTQKVVVGEDNTYEVQIKNEGATAVAVEGDVSATEIITMYQTIYPYSSLGTPVVLVGSISLIYGGFTSPNKRLYRKTRRRE